MDLKHLRYFRAVAEHGSFTAAAAALNIAQPALSIAIRKLEEELELQLFHRGDRGVTPTSEGLVLLEHARDLLARAEVAELQMRELRGLLKGEVRIGVPTMMGSYFFPPLLMAFKHRYPGLRLAVQEAGTRSLQRMVQNGELDIGVVVADEPLKDLQLFPCLRPEVVVCMPQDHALAQRSALSVEEMLSQELVVAHPGYFLREFIEQHARDSGIGLRIAFETNLISLSTAIVRQGFGVAVVLRMVVELEHDPGLVAVPFDPPMYIDLALACKNTVYLSHADRAFLDFMREQTEEQGA